EPRCRGCFLCKKPVIACSDAGFCAHGDSWPPRGFPGFEASSQLFHAPQEVFSDPQCRPPSSFVSNCKAEQVQRVVLRIAQNVGSCRDTGKNRLQPPDEILTDDIDARPDNVFLVRAEKTRASFDLVTGKIPRTIPLYPEADSNASSTGEGCHRNV